MLMNGTTRLPSNTNYLKLSTLPVGPELYPPAEEKCNFQIIKNPETINTPQNYLAMKSIPTCSFYNSMNIQSHDTIGLYETNVEEFKQNINESIRLYPKN
jgi:hypothetical protein